MPPQVTCVSALPGKTGNTKIAFSTQMMYIRALQAVDGVLYSNVGMQKIFVTSTACKSIMQTWFDFDRDIIDAAIDQRYDHVRSSGVARTFCWGGLHFYCTILQSYMLMSSAAISAQNNFRDWFWGYIYGYTPVSTALMRRVPAGGGLFEYANVHFFDSSEHFMKLSI